MRLCQASCHVVIKNRVAIRWCNHLAPVIKRRWKETRGGRRRRNSGARRTAATDKHKYKAHARSSRRGMGRRGRGLSLNVIRRRREEEGEEEEKTRFPWRQSSVRANNHFVLLLITGLIRGAAWRVLHVARNKWAMLLCCGLSASPRQRERCDTK